jgi:uroporphyrinogen-III synthase
VRPLRGRVLLTAATPAMHLLATELRAAGVDVLEVAAVTIAPPEDPRPLRDAVRALDTYDWIAFTSANAVRAVCDVLPDTALPAGLRVASVGPSTTRALGVAFPSRGADAQPDSDHTAEGLADVLVAQGLAGRRVFLPLSDRAREVLAVRLRAAGANVDCVVAYRTVVNAGAGRPSELPAGGVDLAVFASPSAVEAFVAMAGEAARRVEAVVIGPTTAAAAREAGLAVAAVAEPSTMEGLRAAVLARLEFGTGPAAPGEP